MEERLGEMRKGRRERIEIVSSSPQGMTSWSSSIKIWFFQTYRMHCKKKICDGVKQYAKICAIVEQNVIN